MDYASVGSVQIGGPYHDRLDRPRTRRAAARSSSVSRRPSTRTRRACATKILSRIGAARLSPAGHEQPTSQTLLEFFDRRAGATGGKLRRRHSVRARTACSSIPTSCCASIAIRAQPPQDSGAYRLSDLELASRLSFFLWSSIPDERLLDLAERGQLTRPGDARAGGAAHAGRPARHRRARRQLRRAVAEPAPRRAKWSSIPISIRTSTTTCSRRSSRKRSCSSPARSARIAACSICCARTTRSSTSGWRGTTGFRASTAAASAASRSRIPISAAGCSRKAALLATTSYPDRTSPVLRGKWLLEQHLRPAVPPPPPGVDTNLAGHQAGRARRRRSASGWRSTGTNPVVRSCHSVIDPLGLRAREFRRDRRVADRRRIGQAGRRESARRLSGAKVEGLSGLRALLLDRARAVSRARSPKSCWPTRSAGGSSTTISPPCARSSATRRPHDYRWSSLILGIVKSPPFLMRASPRRSDCELTSETTDHDVPHRRRSLPRRTVLRGLGATLALPFLDAMVPAFSLRGRAAAQTGAPVPDLLRAERHGDGVLDAEGRGQRLRALADSRAAGAVPEPDARAVGPQGELELHPRRAPRDRSSPARRAADATRSRSSPTSRWTSCSRGSSRSETQVASLELVDGRPGQRRRVHRQSELRLHAHDLVAQPDAAAADGVQPARGVRAAVRRQRQHRPRGARSAAAAAQEHPRLGDREAGGPQARARARRTRSRSTSTPRRFATSSGASRRPRNSATSSCRRWTSRRACRRSSRITWR